MYNLGYGYGGGAKILVGIFLAALILAGYGFLMRNDPTLIINKIMSDPLYFGAIFIAGAIFGAIAFRSY